MSYFESPLFKISPPLVQETMFCARNLLRRGIYFAGGTPRIRRELLHMENWSADRLAAYQAERLANLVRFVAQNVPHYRDLFREIELDAESVKGPGDLRRIPRLNRSAVRANPDRFMALRVRRALLSKGLTTGTTGGTPLAAYRDLSSICWEEARLGRWRLRAGVGPGVRRAIFRGDHFAPTSRPNRPWLHDRLNNLLFVSIYHLSDELMPALLAKLQDFAPVAVEGYPSAILTLARFLLRTDQHLAVRAVLTSSEHLYDHQRQAMRTAFTADVFDQYGNAERVALASECTAHRLHLDMEGAITEILRPDGTVCGPGEAGEVVGTCLTNFAMPFIRYRTGDVAVLGDDPCPCSLKSPVLGQLHGRDIDFVLGPTGRRFSPTVLTFPFDYTPCIAESQLVQDRPGHLLVRLVPEVGAHLTDLEQARRFVEKGLQELMGGGMNIDFEIVTGIQKGPTGKYRWVLSGITERDPLLNSPRQRPVQG
jgi:phenylacetate-CoA ligase